VGWYLRVLVPGVVPTCGEVKRLAADPVGLSVATVHAAIQDRERAYPEVATHPALAMKAARALTTVGRDITGGVPETDG
jgi:MOSC domain-containing protein YiiM